MPRKKKALKKEMERTGESRCAVLNRWKKGVVTDLGKGVTVTLHGEQNVIKRDDDG